MSNLSLRSLPAATVSALLLAAAGCGDSTGTTATQSTTSPTTVDPPDTEPPPDDSSGSTAPDTPTTSPTNPVSTGTASESGSSSSSGSETTDGIKYDVGSAETGTETNGNCEPDPGDGSIEGTVVAPNLIIPVSGALVYATENIPEGVPNHVYCAECVELPCGTEYVLSNPDGSFSLPTRSGLKYIVVQKGQFMRVTPIELAAGVNKLEVEVTSLPDRRDEANGLYIPNIALAVGEYDRLEDALGKLGLADTLIDNNNHTEDFVPGTQQFDMWDNSDSNYFATMGTIADLAADPAKLEKYHILFVPCSSDPFITAMFTDTAKDNLRNWVAAGGRFYVSDWSNEYLFAGFGQYQMFYQDKDFGGSDLLSPYDSQGTVLDPDLLAWLDALPPALKDINPANGGFSDHPVINALPQIATVDNWSGVSATPKILVDDGMGGQVDVGHKTWIEGPGDGYNIPFTPEPLTITGQYGCGKIMFTTYHMAEFEDSYVGLTPQELVLLYLILEIGVCQQAFEPPPPPD